DTRFECIGESVLETNGVQDQSGPKKSKVFYHDMCNGQYGLSLVKPEDGMAPRVCIWRSWRDWLEDQLDGPGIRDLMVREPGLEHNSMIELLLSEASDLRIDGTQDIIMGMRAVVVRGTTKHGRITLWAVRAKGFVLAKWQWELGPNDILDGNRTSERWPDFRLRTKCFEAHELMEVQGSEHKLYYIPRRFTVTDDVVLRGI
ncbi:MAG: hypothetical protein QHH07_12230, partial [Sedimentisphaerales bacterium]|nr:hypothetical protein [Sedimentisphaerales bacterium]